MKKVNYLKIGHSDFLCSEIDNQIPKALMHIQVDPKQVPAIRDFYMQDIAEILGHIYPNERDRLQELLRSIDKEETRMARIFAAGQITESIWESLWYEWQDRRNKIRTTLDSMEDLHETHITNSPYALDPHPKSFSLRAKDFQTAECFFMFSLQGANV